MSLRPSLPRSLRNVVSREKWSVHASDDVLERDVGSVKSSELAERPVR